MTSWNLRSNFGEGTWMRRKKSYRFLTRNGRGHLVLNGIFCKIQLIWDFTLRNHQRIYD